MPSIEFIRPLLRGFGYELMIDPGPPVVCRAVVDAEVWESSGSTAEEAIDKLLRSMCPSSLAWDLFLEALHGGAASEHEPTQQLPTTAGPVSRPVARVEVVGAPPHPAARSPLDELEAALPAIARSSPERMRLALLRRVCGARAAAGSAPHAAAAAQSVTARILEIAKLFWTGSAPGLRGDARPGDVGAVRRGWVPPQTWAEAADTARRALEDVDDRGLRAGHDAFGWADTAALDPPPPDPGALHAAVQAELDLLLGVPGGETPAAPPLRAKRLEAATRRIRWLRDAIDPVAWATTAGRVRRAVIDIGPDGEGAERLLDPAFRPPTSWATLDRFAPLPTTDDASEGDDDDDDDEPPPPSIRPVSGGTGPATAMKPHVAEQRTAPAVAPRDAEPPSSVASPSSSKAPSASPSKRGPEPPPLRGSPGELAGWALRVLDQLDTPEFLLLARPVGAELRNLGEGGIPTRDRRIKRKWREVLRRLG